MNGNPSPPGNVDTRPRPARQPTTKRFDPSQQDRTSVESAMATVIRKPHERAGMKRSNAGQANRESSKASEEEQQLEQKRASSLTFLL
jgi:hypothetical protein